MQDRLKWTQSALVRILRPAVRLALAMGLKHAQLEEILRDLLLEEARHLWRSQGIPDPNLSQISVTTGLNRKDVTARVRQVRDPLPATEGSSAAKAFTAWLQLAAEEPSRRRLPIVDTGHGPSFELVARLATRGDVHHRTLLEELQRLNLVRGLTGDGEGEVELVGDGFIPAMLMSLAVTGLTLITALVFAFMTALALSRFTFRSRKSLVVAVLVIQMVPAEALIISMFRLLDGWHLVNTVLGLSAVYIAMVLPFTIWTLRGFVQGVPADLEEAAQIDGCSKAGAFWRITFPLLAPGLLSTGIFAFIQAWNEFVFALVIMTREESQTLPIWLRSFLQATKATDWSVVMAGSTLMALPVVVLFLIVQGRMTSSMTSGAVKG